MKRPVALLLGAVAITLLSGLLLRDTPGYMVRNPDGSLSGDITHYVYWTRLVTLEGVPSAYSGTWPETYAVYPPVTLYAYAALGSAYRAVQDPAFDVDRAQHSLWLRAGIKGVALGFHVLTGLAIFFVARRWWPTRPWRAAAGSALYLVNPAAVYDVAHWAQPDGAHALFSVLAIGVLDIGLVGLAWAAMAAAALAKPQAWSILPLVAIATVRGHGPVGLARGLAWGGGVAALIVLPFLVTGHALELASLPGTISSVMPVASADAHNLWWLVIEPRGQDPLLVPDTTRVLGPLTYRLLAGGLVGLMLLLTCWLYWTRRATLPEAAALGVLGWFTFTTQAHENHLFFALPLLSLAWPDRRSLLVPFGVLSLTLLLNMLLHDQLILEALGSGLYDPTVERLRLANAATNVVCCLAWTALAALRQSIAAPTSARVSYSPRHTAGVGLEVARD